MNDMLVATRAILFPLDALRVQAAVLRGEVVPVFAVVAGENDFVSRHVLDSDGRWRMAEGGYGQFVISIHFQDS
jgi:hypothetical protein